VHVARRRRARVDWMTRDRSGLYLSTIFVDRHVLMVIDLITPRPLVFFLHHHIRFIFASMRIFSIYTIHNTVIQDILHVTSMLLVEGSFKHPIHYRCISTEHLDRAKSGTLTHITDWAIKEGLRNYGCSWGLSRTQRGRRPGQRRRRRQGRRGQ
jgi:hypothetical protein